MMLRSAGLVTLLLASLSHASTPGVDAPPVESGRNREANLVELVTLDPTIKLDVRYATANNFLGKPVYTEARAFLQKDAAEALVRAGRVLKDKGYGLLVYDGYRPWRVTKAFWDATPEDKKEFVANPKNGSRHNRGCAVDVSLYDLATGREVDMGGAYDEMSEKSYVTWKGGTKEQLARRDLLRTTLTNEGFFVLAEEWWHFDYKDWTSFPILDIPFSAIGKPSAPRLLVHAGRLIDGVADVPRTQVTIVVEGDRVVSIETGFRKPAAGEALLDLSTKTVLPGLIDMHVHLGTEASPQAYIEQFTMGVEAATLRAAVHARRTLQAGFTTVRNLGDSGRVNVALREAIRRGDAEGPRIFTAGKALATTGGHADPTNGWAEPLAGDPGAREGVVNGVEDAQKAVRQRYKDGADLIKITATGGVLSLAKNGQNPQFQEDEIAAVVRTAKDYDFAIAAHAHGLEGMKRAIRAGVDSIEHGSYLDEETMALMKQKGTWLVPTLSASRFVAEKAKIPGFLPEVVRIKAQAIGPLASGMFAKAVKAGVNIAFGTDCGVSPHGENAKEFVYMVEGGMAPMKAIQAATSQAAKLLRAESDLGSLQKGRLADFIAVTGDPLADVSLLQSVEVVVKGGVVVKGTAPAR